MIPISNCVITGDYKTRDDQSRSWRAFAPGVFPLSVQGFRLATYMGLGRVAQPQIPANNIDQSSARMIPARHRVIRNPLRVPYRNFISGRSFELFHDFGAFAVVRSAACRDRTLHSRCLQPSHADALTPDSHSTRRGSNRYSGYVFTIARIIASRVGIGLLASYDSPRFLTS